MSTSNDNLENETTIATIASSENVIKAYPVLESKDISPKFKKWAHGFCDLCYVDKEHNNKFCPYCCPFAWPCSCVI
jgi:hypothetical protein